ncbi:MAG: tRNA pseudouridine synthase A [Armatimonadetes bacterium]|nr:tRNA pseudouridine synthase A [Armatimonadota bacterium]
MVEARMPTIRLDVQYDGTDFHGFQKQPALRTVAGELEKCCAILCNEPVRIIGAGRTDAGVHAVHQVVSFTTSAKRGTDAFVRGLNSLLSPDISILSAAIVPDCFHARRSARARSYKYFLVDHNVKLALLQRYACVFLRAPMACRPHQGPVHNA